MTYEEALRLYYENGGQFLPPQETGEWGGMSGGYFQPVTLPDGRTLIPAEGGVQVTRMDGSERNYGELLTPDGASRPLDYTGENRSFGSRLFDVAAPVLGITGGAALLGAATGALGGMGGGAAAAPIAASAAPTAAAGGTGLTMGAGGSTGLLAGAGGAAGITAPMAAGAATGGSMVPTLGGIGSFIGQNANWLLPALGAVGNAMGGDESRSSGLPEWMQPYAQEYLQRAQQLSQTPFTPYGGQGVAPINADQQTAIAQARQLATGGDPNVNAARQQQMNVVQGGMLNSNPYIDQVARGIGDRMGEAYATGTRGNLTSTFAQSGNDPRYSSAYQQTVGNTDRAFADSLGQTMAGLYGDNYRQERAAQDMAARFSPAYAADTRTNTEGLFNAGLLQQQTNQAQNNFDFSQFQAAQQYPFQMNNVLGSAINPQFGQTQTYDDGVPWWARAAGGAAAGYAASRSLYPSQQQTGQSAPFPAYFGPRV